MMNSDKTIKEIVDSKLSKVTVDQELKDKILSSTENSRRVRPRPMLIAVTVCLLIVFSVPVMATIMPSFNNLIYLISPQVAQFLQPLGLTSESNGIRMEVIAAMNDDETAIVYLTLQDLTGKNRVDQTVDLYDYSIKGANTFTHELVDYNEATNTATIRMIANGGKQLNGKKVTVRVTSFLSGKEYFSKVPSGITLKEIASQTPETILLNMNNIPGGGGELYPQLKQKGIINVLKPGQTIVTMPNIDFVNISSIGYVDGRLHVQAKWNESIDNHGYVYLVNSSNDIIHPNGSISFGIDHNGKTEYGRNYKEYIFEVDPVQISDYSLYGYFVKNNNYTEGNWKTTFRIKSIDEDKKMLNNINLGEIKIDKLTVTPMGISIIGNPEGLGDMEIDIIMADGTMVAINHEVKQQSNNKATVKYLFDVPIEVENIKGIRINHESIDFEK